MINGPDWRTRRHLWLPGRKALFAIGSVALALCSGCSGQSKSSSLDGHLTVLVRPPDRTIEPVGLEQLGALPVKHGGAMVLDARLKEPALVYLIWIDPEGNFRQLYPWNNESLEIKDFSQPPPERRQTNLVFSPLLGRNWTFGDVAGTETVLLLARRTPLDKGTQWGELLKSLPAPPKLEPPEEMVAVKLERGTSLPGTAKSGESALAEFLEPLSEHFELVRAVQFRHGENGEGAKLGEAKTER